MSNAGSSSQWSPAGSEVVSENEPVAPEEGERSQSGVRQHHDPYGTAPAEGASGDGSDGPTQAVRARGGALGSPDRADGDHRDEGEIADEITQRVTAQLLNRSLHDNMPDPETMRAYAAMFPDASERLLRIVEAQTVDASARADRLVNAEIEAAKQGRQAATLLIATCLVAAIILLFRDELAAAAILLTLPAIMVLRSLMDERHTED